MYVPNQMGAFRGRRIRHIGRPYQHMQMGGFFDDVLTGIETSATRAVKAGVEKITGTARAEAAAAASKAVTKALQKNKYIAPKKPGTVIPSATLPALEDTAPRTPTGISAPVPQVPQVPQGSAFAAYAPYAVAVVGGTILVVLIARRRK